MARTVVSETDKDISIVAELPGVSQQDVEVSLDDDVRAICAETRDQSSAEPAPLSFSPVGSSVWETERHLGHSRSRHGGTTICYGNIGQITVASPDTAHLRAVSTGLRACAQYRCLCVPRHPVQEDYRQRFRRCSSPR
jgi:hypothetical protein